MLFVDDAFVLSVLENRPTKLLEAAKQDFIHQSNWIEKCIIKYIDCARVAHL